MQLQDYVRILLKRGWIIILMAVLTALSATVFSKLQTPIYRSEMTLSVLPSRTADWGSGQASKILLLNYVKEMQSPLLTQPVIDKLQLDVSPDKFESQLNFNADESTLTINFEARHPIPAVAQKMAQTLGEAFVSRHEQKNLTIDQQDRIIVEVMRPASSPALFSPNTKVNAVAGAVLGALIGLLIVFVLEWLESDIVRTAEDVERYIGTTVLGAIPTMADREGGAQTASARRRWFGALGAK